LKAQIKSTNQKLAEVTELITEAVEQSSETTHDNAPYDAAVSERDKLRGEHSALSQVLQRSEIFIPTASPIEVGIGTLATLFANKDERVVEIAGDWHGRHQSGEDTLVLNRRSALAEKLIGKKIGDIVDMENADRTVSQISSSSQLSEASVDAISSPEAKSEAEKKWLAERLIIISGSSGSGKSTIVQTALSRDFATVDLNHIAVKAFEADPRGLTFPEWENLEIDEFGFGYEDSLLVEAVTEIKYDVGSHPKGIIIVGLNNTETISTLAESVSAPGVFCIFINATKREIYKRSDKPRHLLDAEFENDNKQGLMQLAAKADLKILNLDKVEDAAAKLLAGIDEWKL